MCGRYSYKLSWKQIVELYRLTLPEEQSETLRESYNVAPIHVMPIIRPAGNGRELLLAGRRHMMPADPRRHPCRRSGQFRPFGLPLVPWPGPSLLTRAPRESGRLLPEKQAL
jgi:putative SOS response-associated peptidase YedK